MDETIRKFARRIYEGDTSLIPLLARLHSRASDDERLEFWLVERWIDDRSQSDKWVLASYEDATEFVARLMISEIENEIEEMDEHGWMGPDREQAWKLGRLRARRALRNADYVGVVEAFEAIRTDLVHFGREGIRFVINPAEGSE